MKYQVSYIVLAAGVVSVEADSHGKAVTLVEAMDTSDLWTAGEREQVMVKATSSAPGDLVEYDDEDIDI